MLAASFGSSVRCNLAQRVYKVIAVVCKTREVSRYWLRDNSQVAGSQDRVVVVKDVQVAARRRDADGGMIYAIDDIDKLIRLYICKGELLAQAARKENE